VLQNPAQPPSSSLDARHDRKHRRSHRRADHHPLPGLGRHPCLNEAENIERCVELALNTLALHALPGGVIVTDQPARESGELCCPT
jgi:hypothetical protein